MEQILSTETVFSCFKYKGIILLSQQRSRECMYIETNNYQLKKDYENSN